MVQTSVDEPLEGGPSSLDELRTRTGLFFAHLHFGHARHVLLRRRGHYAAIIDVFGHQLLVQTQEVAESAEHRELAGLEVGQTCSS